MELGVPEAAGGGVFGIATILLWQFVRLVKGLNEYVEGLGKHHEKVEKKLDDVIIAIRGIAGVPSHVERQPTPVRDLGEHRL